ncbi:MAG: hypothetical protein WC455_30640 [Dehalococcoidia bacterium]|jgi:hypothetical protein
MANTQAWWDRQSLLDYYSNIKAQLDTVVATNTSIQTPKDAIIADSERTAQFQQLMLEDPTLTTELVLQKIAQIKAMADYIVANPL